MVVAINEPKPRPRLAWIRYGYPISDWQLKRAVGNFRVAILQPWETQIATKLKEADPAMTVLAYKCLSSVRDYEPGPVFSSGISPSQAAELGTTAGVADWAGYGGHIQQQVWNPTYQEAWVSNVVSEIADSPFDGVMADNDVWEDYYGHGLDMEQTRAGLETIINQAGTDLNAHGKILVPNIAESRLQEGRWHRHSRYGGGYEECWLGWGSSGDGWLSIDHCLDQVAAMDDDGLIIARVPGSTKNYTHHLRLALASAWVFLPHRDIAVSATGHDKYNGIPLFPDIDLGEIESDIQREGDTFMRKFQHGEAYVNLGDEINEYGMPPKTGKLVTRE